MEDIDALKREVDRWKYLAAYLASCHAATLESLPKSASKSFRQRMATICRNSVGYLNGESDPPRHGRLDEVIKYDITRCEEAAKKYGVQEPTKS